MRPKIYIPLILFFLLLCYLGTRIHAFVQLFFEHSGVAVTQLEAVAAHNSSKLDLRPQLIPKIIHQVFHDWKNLSSEVIPSDWDEVRQTCIDRNPDFEYRLWTAKTSRAFLSEFYPWFLKTYDSYPFPIQRVDAVRYFILRHYGGIYLDLDNGCLDNLTPLLYYPVWITDGGCGALSNNIIASSVQHPFWVRLTDALPRFNYNYFFPYVTISYASGQWFETQIWQEYHANRRAESETEGVRLMMDEREGGDPWVFFTQERGGTWGNWDNIMFLWIGEHLPLFTFGIITLVVLAVWGIFKCVKGANRRHGYKPVHIKREDDEV